MKKNNLLKWITFSVFGLIALFSACLIAGNFWLKNNKIPENIAQLENALLHEKSASLISSVDLKQFRKIEFAKSLFKSKQAEADENFLENILPFKTIKSAGIYQNTDYAIASINLTQKESSKRQDSEWFFILSGNYSNKAIIETLNRSFEVEASNDFFKLTKKPQTHTDQEEYSCPKDEKNKKVIKSLYVWLNPDFITFSESAEILNNFKQRLSENKTNTQDFEEQINQWRKFKEKRLFAASLINQDLLKKHFITASAQKEILDDQEIDLFRIGADIATLQRGLKLSLDIGSSDKTALQEAKTKLDEGLEKIKKQSIEDFPSMVRLSNRVSSQVGDQLNLSITLDNKIIDDLSKLADEFKDYIFSDLEAGSDKQEEEKIVEKPWDYSLNPLLINKQAYTLGTFDKYKPIYRKNQFAIFLDAIKIAPPQTFSSSFGKKEKKPQNELNDLLTLKFSLKQKISDRLEDYTLEIKESGIEREFHINDVLDHKGNSLLRDERCLEKAIPWGENHKPTTQFGGSNTEVSAEKTVRLAKGVQLEDVHNIMGYYSVKVPTKVHKELLSMDGKREFTWGDNKLKLTKISGSSVNYKMRKETEDIISVRALNDKGQVLSHSFSMSGPKSASRTFKGKPKTIEVFIAKEWYNKKEEFSFTLKKPSPIKLPNQYPSDTTLYLLEPDEEKLLNSGFKAESLNESEKEAVSKILQWKRFNLDQSKEHNIGSTSTKRAWIGFTHDVNRTWGKKLETNILIPFSPTILSSHNSMTVELSIDGKESLTQPIQFTHSTFNGKISPSGKLDDSRQIQLISSGFDLDESQEKISQIVGKINYSIPREIKSIKMPVESFGVASQNDEYSIQLTSVDYGWGNDSAYKLTGDISDLVKASAANSEGQVTLGKIENSEGITTVNFDGTSKFEYIELHIATDKAVFSEDFKVTPVYKQ